MIWLGVVYIIIAVAVFFVQVDVYEDMRIGWQKTALYSLLWLPMLLIHLFKKYILKEK